MKEVVEMDIKELIYQSLEILEEQGNVDINVELLGMEHDFEIVKNFPQTDFEKYVLKVIE
ncbi:hypothetical protein [Salinicoccus sp. YB14-2]|uniref:hypothetical protein n=1 Tax=Salinicoccus sp. YB14-2 TaxID=1572701 RepID=UPI00068AE0E0|nr:hypothetical protein [Salinicoccus sp. YB14-2]